MYVSKLKGEDNVGSIGGRLWHKSYAQVDLWQLVLIVPLTDLESPKREISRYVYEGGVLNA